MNGHSKDETPAIPAAPRHPIYSPSTLAVHADDAVNSTTDVAPAMHVSTTFRYSSNPDELRPTNDDDVSILPINSPSACSAAHSTSLPPSLSFSSSLPFSLLLSLFLAFQATPPTSNPNLQLPTRAPDLPAPADTHIYSRLSSPNTSRLEALLSALLRAPTLTYASGLAAFHALLIHLSPRIVAIGAGYHGCHGVLAIYKRLSHCRIVDLHDPSSWSGTDPETGRTWTLGKGDVVHLETPLNPTGEASDIAHHADLAHERGAFLTVDATFAPPPLQDPFVQGADYVMHSGTKYFGGHSDMLCGTLSLRRGVEGWEERYWALYKDRLFLGATMGSLEGWLGVRSLRTLELRVVRQSKSATNIVGWLDGLMKGEDGAGSEEERGVVGKTVERVQHASLQKSDMGWLGKQMPGGFGPVFSVWMKSERMARRLPSRLELFHHATSLGGVESLIEWRRMSDATVDERVLRVSIGVEDVEDLKSDLMTAFRALAAEA